MSDHQQAVFAALESADHDDQLADGLRGVAEYLEGVILDMGLSFEEPGTAEALESVIQAINTAIPSIDQ